MAALGGREASGRRVKSMATSTAANIELPEATDARTGSRPALLALNNGDASDAAHDEPELSGPLTPRLLLRDLPFQ